MRWIVVNEFLDVFSDSEKLKEILKPVIKISRKNDVRDQAFSYIDDALISIILKQKIEDLRLNDSNSEILNNLKIQFLELPILERLYLQTTFDHECGHVCLALTQGFNFTSVILRGRFHYHVFCLIDQGRSEIQYFTLLRKDIFKCTRSRGIALFNYRDYSRDGEIFYKMMVVSLGGVVMDLYKRRKGKKRSCNSFGIKRNCKGRVFINPKSDADHLIDNFVKGKNASELYEIKIPFLDDLNEVNNHFYLGTSKKDEFLGYPIKEIVDKKNKL